MCEGDEHELRLFYFCLICTHISKHSPLFTSDNSYSYSNSNSNNTIIKSTHSSRIISNWALICECAFQTEHPLHNTHTTEYTTHSDQQLSQTHYTHFSSSAYTLLNASEAPHPAQTSALLSLTLCCLLMFYMHQYSFRERIKQTMMIAIEIRTTMRRIRKK